MNKVNNFQTAKIQPQGVAYLLLDFFANFSLLLVIKVLHIKKACNSWRFYKSGTVSRLRSKSKVLNRRTKILKLFSNWSRYFARFPSLNNELSNLVQLTSKSSCQSHQLTVLVGLAASALTRKRFSWSFLFRCL